MEDGRRGLGELLETKIFTLGHLVSLFSSYELLYE